MCMNVLIVAGKNCIIVSMDKVLEFGRKALFYVRVLSGYEERKIRKFRLQLEQRAQQVCVFIAYISISFLQ